MNKIAKTGYYLKPGYLFLGLKPHVIRTVLGSCVAVCLWDSNLGIGAMNHYIYPRMSNKGESTVKYGNVAVATLIKMMEEAGSRPDDLDAQIFGGGYPDEIKGSNVGEENVRVARKILAQRGINVVSEDVGGTMGRKIIFDTDTGEAVVFKVQKIRASDWFSPEGK